jgi:DNA-binding CsgD family transcriptional regulator
MSSIKENNKLGNRNQQHSNSGSTLTTSTSTNQTLKREQGNNNTREEATAKRTKRRTTKVGLNDTLRRIRQLMVEGRSNSEIQDILQLEERTFYRYMAKIYEIDQALFAEQEKKTIKTEMSILKDRLLKSYRWCIAMADNENIREDTRMQAQNLALEVAAAVLRLEAQGP